MLASYDYAVVRLVPRVEREEFLNVGVILFCRTRRYLGARVGLNRALAALFAGEATVPWIEQHLDLLSRITAGGEGAGPIGQLSTAERFHWLVAPSSTIIQTSAVHCGLCSAPEEALDHLFDVMVGSHP